MSETQKRTAPGILAMKGQKKIVSVTAYDTPFAQYAHDAGVDIILVGDTVGSVVMGQRNTLGVGLVEMEHHTQAVAMAKGPALIVADLPFGSYGTCVSDAVKAAVILAKAGAHAVKLEGTFLEEIAAITHVGIPVMGHIGMTPQSVHRFGSYKRQGVNHTEIDELELAAQAIEHEGAFAIVLELVQNEAAKKITNSIAIPTIGIGSGPSCDGQVQVMHDLLGLTSKSYIHAKRFAELGEATRNAFEAYANAVRDGTFPGDENSF